MSRTCTVPQSKLHSRSVQDNCPHENVYKGSLRRLFVSCGVIYDVLSTWVLYFSGLSVGNSDIIIVSNFEHVCGMN